MDCIRYFRMILARYVAVFLLIALVCVTIINIHITRQRFTGKSDGSNQVLTVNAHQATERLKMTSYTKSCNEEDIAQKLTKAMAKSSNQKKKQLVLDLRKLRDKLMNIENVESVANSIGDLKAILGSLGEEVYDFKNEVSAETSKKLLVCPEKYTNSTAGYPFFYNGWDLEECKGVPRFSDVLTISINALREDENFVNKRLLPMLFDIAKNYSGLSVHIASKKIISKEELQKLDLKVEFHSEALDEKSPGKTWNYLVKVAKTPYVLIARNMDYFLGMDARLERLIRQIDSLKLDFVGSAYRNLQGHWSMNCHQMTIKNFSLVYQTGYHASKEECVFCDDVTGPFVARTEFLKGQAFDENLAEDILFHDFFIGHKLRKSKMAVCPDSMFYVDYTERRKHVQSKWLPVAKKYRLLNILLPNNEKLKFGCQELELECKMVKGTALSPCCLKELADMIKFFMKTCEREGMLCELQEGTLLGALKLGKVLPWERDADLTFFSGNFSKLKTLGEKFRKNGYRFTPGTELW